MGRVDRGMVSRGTLPPTWTGITEEPTHRPTHPEGESKIIVVLRAPRLYENEIHLPTGQELLELSPAVESVNIWDIKKQIKQNRNRLIDIENKLVITG